jgi:hypothetical protein
MRGASAIPIYPVGIYPYVDKIRVWCRTRPTAQGLADLRQMCSADVIVPIAFPRWGIEFFQPPEEALAAIAQRDDWHPSYVEAALDWIFADMFDLDAAKRTFHRHHVQPYHRGDVRIVGATRYSRRRAAPVNTVSYDDRHSKVTGELDCFHVEARLLRAQVLRRFGIHTAADLIGFDHRALWQRCMRFYDLDFAVFGRHVWNWQTGGHRRTTLLRQGYDRNRTAYDFDEDFGCRYFNACCRSMQTLIDNTRHLNTRRYLIALAYDHLLPATVPTNSDHIANVVPSADNPLSDNEKCVARCELSPRDDRAI